MNRFFTEPFRDALRSLERLLVEGPVLRPMVFTIVALVATWFVYVPVHELLHVAGCLATGGSVSRLELAPQYGGALLSRVFPFVVSGGDYAGRLSGFDHKGSDLIYLSTDFLPFVLTIFLGVPWMKACTRSQRPALFGAAVVVGLAPIYNLPGDYYEMGSIISTRLAQVSGMMSNEVAMAMRSDDVFRLIEDLFENPGRYDLSAWAGKIKATGVVLASSAIGVILALATYYAGSLFAQWFTARGPKSA